MNRYVWYAQAVQKPDIEAQFLFSLASGYCLREDFCGSAELTRSWLNCNAMTRAVAVDIDAEPLEYARSLLERAAPDVADDRWSLVRGDSRTVSTKGVDVICAPNASILLLTSRGDLLRYLARSKSDLCHGGTLVIDVFGGPEAHRIGIEHHTTGSVRYTWEQREFDPATNLMECTLHVLSGAERSISAVFNYPMRLWSPAEILDALNDTGYRNNHVLLGRTRHDIAMGRQLNSHDAAELDEWEAYIIAKAA